MSLFIFFKYSLLISCSLDNFEWLVVRYTICNKELLLIRIEVNGSMVLLLYRRYKSVGKTTSRSGLYLVLFGTTSTGHCTLVIMFCVFVPIGIMFVSLVPLVPITMRSISLASTTFRIFSTKLPSSKMLVT